MIYQTYELTGRETCERKRSFVYDFSSKEEEYMKKAQWQRSAIRAGLFEDVSLEELHEYLRDAYEELDKPKETKHLLVEDAYREASRYLLSEGRKAAAAPGRTVTIGTDRDGKPIRVWVQPMAVFYTTVLGRKTIEVMNLKCRGPKDKVDRQKNAGSNLELYALLQYARSLVPKGAIATVKASIYFLKKTTDRKGEKGHFDEAFFKRGGGNVITLEDTCQVHPDGTIDKTMVDINIADTVQKFEEGFSKEECTESDCKFCELFELCHFNKPPLMLKEEKKKRKAMMIRFTPEQNAAIEYDNGICLIDAGAGAGKTLTIAYRVVALLNKDVKPEELFVVTFTNAAAAELRERILLYAEDDGIADEVDVSKIRIQTFNSFGDDIIKEEYERFDFKDAPHLVDDIERSRIISDLLREEVIPGLDYRNYDGISQFGRKGVIEMAATIFSVIKKHPEYTREDCERIYRELGSDSKFCNVESVEKLYELYRDYDDQMRASGLLEYADQEALIFELLGKDPNYMERFGFRHIIVDEAQDCSDKQIQLLRKFVDAPSFESLMYVGDEDQSIYSFREANPMNLVNFDKVMGTKIDRITLEQNQRSTPEILEFSNRVIAKNVKRLGKKLLAVRPSGKAVTVHGFLDADEEYLYIADEIRKKIEGGRKPEDIAIIARKKAELLKLADVLATAGIPSVIQFPELLRENSRVSAAIALLNVLQDADDRNDALIVANAMHDGGLLDADPETIDEAVEVVLKKAAEFRNVRMEDEKEAKELIKELLEQIDRRTEEYPEGKDTVYKSYCDKLLSLTLKKMFEYNKDFELYGTKAAVKREGKYPGVVLTTAHSSKGLEWPVIFLSISSYDTQTASGNEQEEARRLLFVSATRARDELVVTSKYLTGTVASGHANRFYLEALEAIDEPALPSEIVSKAKSESIKKKNKEKMPAVLTA
ncbi:MAG: ATP-dependent helicase [Eubacteriales bacterium]|nr:ATP-dependent helicase [Eubacteriales bacterium]